MKRVYTCEDSHNCYWKWENRKAVEIFQYVVLCFCNWSRMFKKENENKTFSLLVSYLRMWYLSLLPFAFQAELWFIWISYIYFRSAIPCAVHLGIIAVFHLSCSASCHITLALKKLCKWSATSIMAQCWPGSGNWNELGNWLEIPEWDINPVAFLQRFSSSKEGSTTGQGLVISYYGF